MIKLQQAMHKLAWYCFFTCKMLNKPDAFEISKATRVFRIFGLQFLTLDNLESSRNSDSFRLKAVLILNLSAMLAIIAMIIICDLAEEDERLGKPLKFLVWWYFYSVIQSFVCAEKSKTTFRLCKNAQEIFEQNLRMDYNISEFVKKFKTFQLKLTVVSLLINSATFAHCFFTQQSLFLLFLATLIRSIPNFVLTVNIIRFIFFARLIDHNVCLMKQEIILILNSAKQKQLQNQSPFIRIVKVSRVNSFNLLKQIYGMIWKMT